MSDSSESLSPHLVSELMDANVLFSKGSSIVALDIPPGNKFPNIKEEIFRLVEGSFKTIGGETGTGIKTDEFNERIFHQLITVNACSKHEFKMLAGYRYALWEGLMHDIKTPMTHFFDIQDKSVDPQHAKVIELGTARGNPYINQRYQEVGFGNTWNGLAALVEKYQNDYFVGKLTIPSGYNAKARDFAINYLQNFTTPSFYFDAAPKKEFIYVPGYENMEFSQKNWERDREKINMILAGAEYGGNNKLPAMFPMYLPRLQPEKFHYTGTVRNGDVCESGIVVPISAVRPEVHDSFKKSLQWMEKSLEQGRISH